MQEYLPVYIYFVLTALVTLIILAFTALFPTVKDSTVKFMPYESGVQTQTELLQKRFPLRHYLVALIFLVFDIEVIFLFPWAVIAKTLGPFAFYEMLLFWIALIIGFVYVWRKKGLEWE
jgi:NADH-quinone oxidoreductase subunit A